MGKNSIALGLVLALITLAFSFSANGATKTVPTSHSEARYLMGENAVGDLVDQVGGALEENGTSACEPVDGNCDGEDFITSPLDPLKKLTVPIGNGLDLNLGAVNDYSEAGHNNAGASSAASGAIDSNGIIDTDNPRAPSGAILDLTGLDSALNPLNGVANVKLQLGAISSTASLGQDDSTLKRDYNIASGKLILSVPALRALGENLNNVVTEKLKDPLELNGEQVCSLLDNIPDVPDAVITGCKALSDPLDTAIGGEVSGLSDVTDGLTTVSQKGIIFNFKTGEIKINLDKAIFAATGSHLNELPENTHLLDEILPNLVLNLKPVINKIQKNVVDQLLENGKIKGTGLIGSALPPLELKTLGDAGLRELLDTVLDGVQDGLDQAKNPLADALETISEQLRPLVDIIVNVPDLYTNKGVSTDKSAARVSQTAGDAKFYSETALQIKLLDSQLADLRLGNSQVGPNGPADVDDQADADANANADADANAITDADAATNADTDAAADADANADAGVTSTLPNTGAPNLIPLFLLALGLIGFGTAVLANEKRRLGKI